MIDLGNQERLHGTGIEEILKWEEERKEILGRGNMSNGTKMRNRDIFREERISPV